jgi:hypothetical protein
MSNARADVVTASAEHNVDAAVPDLDLVAVVFAILFGLC